MADSDSQHEGHEAIDMFAEPADYYPPSPKPTTESHALLDGTTLTVSLVGHNPLWGHHLWQAGRLVSTYLEHNPALIQNKSVLELGAGAGLPSLVCARLGAKRVVVTDYPDPDLVSNLWENVDAFYTQFALPTPTPSSERPLVASGYCWGADPAPLLSHLPVPGFDVLILADLLFNHSEHSKLVATVESCLAKSREAKALVFFTPYRPWLYEKDMAFFKLCEARGFVVDKVLEEKMEKVMFAEDRGDEELRRTVFGYVVSRSG